MHTLAYAAQSIGYYEYFYNVQCACVSSGRCHCWSVYIYLYTVVHMCILCDRTCARIVSTSRKTDNECTSIIYIAKSGRGLQTSFSFSYFANEKAREPALFSYEVYHYLIISVQHIFSRLVGFMPHACRYITYGTLCRHVVYKHYIIYLYIVHYIPWYLYHRTCTEAVL